MMKKLWILAVILTLIWSANVYGVDEGQQNYPTSLDTTGGTDCTSLPCFDGTAGEVIHSSRWDTYGNAIIALETKVGITDDNPADTEILVGKGASDTAWEALSGDVTMTNGGVVTVSDDSHAHVFGNIDAFTEANLYSILNDVTQFWEAGDTFTSGATGAGFTVDLDTSTVTCTNCIAAANVAADVATQAEIDLKAPLANPVLTGLVDIGGGAIEIPNVTDASTVVDAVGEMAVETDVEQFWVQVDADSILKIDVTGCTNGEVMEMNASGVFVCATDDTAGAPTLNSIGDPTGASSWTMESGETVTFTSAEDGAASWVTVQNSSATQTSQMYLLDLDHSAANQADTNADFLRCQDVDGAVFTIGEDGNTSIQGTLGVTGVGTFTAQTVHSAGASMNDQDIADVGVITLDQIDPDGITMVIGDNTSGITMNAAAWDISGSGTATGIELDADNSTITNIGSAEITNDSIVDADINSSAAIDATKIADGTVTSAEFQYVGDVTSAIQAQLDGKEGTLTNEAGLYSALSDVSEFIETGDAATIATLDTGQGANELYDMNQNVLTTSSPTFAGGTIGGDFNLNNGSTSAGYVDIFEDSTNGSNYMTLQSAASIASNFALTFPADAGTDTYVLTTNGTGTLSWTAPSAGTGDVTSVGDCVTGACNDGSSDGGTYIRLYDGDSAYGQIETANLTGNRTITVPNSDETIGTATLVTVTDNEDTNESNAVVFLPGGDLDGGTLALESDGTFNYNPSTGTVAATILSATDDVSVADDVLLANGSVVGITGNEVITFNAAGTINVTGAAMDVDGALTATSFVADGDVTSTDDTIASDDLRLTADDAVVHFGSGGETTITYASASDTLTLDDNLEVSGTLSGMTSVTVDASATPTITLSDSDDAAGTGDIYATSSGGSNDVIMTLGVEVAGSNVDYVEVDGVSETVRAIKPVEIGATSTSTADAGALRFENAAVIGFEDATEATITHVDNTGFSINLALDVVGALTGGSVASDADVTSGDSFIIGSADVEEAELEILDGATVTTTELNYLASKTLSGSDTEIITGTGGTTNYVTVWNADDDLVDASTPILPGNTTLGIGGAGVDYTFTINGESDDCVLTYDEDNNELETGDTTLVVGGDLSVSGDMTASASADPKIVLIDSDFAASPKPDGYVLDIDATGTVDGEEDVDITEQIMIYDGAGSDSSLVTVRSVDATGDYEIGGPDGKVTLKSVLPDGTPNNEDLTFDMETTANEVGVSSSTGVTDIDFGSLNMVTTGTIQGHTEVTNKSTDATLTDAEMNGMVFVTATATITLPAVEIGQSVCVYSTTAAAVHVKAGASDRIRLDGTDLDDADKVTSASAAGDFICLIGDSAVGWTTLGRSGTWTDGGA